ncbi:MAG TPA: glucan biosynthesis protein [Candidatus Tectomicrobia bacterium]
MRRRDFLKAVSAVPVGAWLSTVRRYQGGGSVATAAETPAFSAAEVQEQARALAAKKFVPPKIDLPAALLELDYDQYRDIRFKLERAIWNDEGLPFLVELFHRGFYYKEPVVIYIVARGQALPLLYSPDFFTFGPRVPSFPSGTVTDFAGFRLRAPINRSDHFDEFAVFQGASYFRAVAKGQEYGLSARGLALRTGDPEGEEFPFFRTFWIERPRAGASTVVVHALLDSPRTTGAYRFTIRPGEPTVMDVEMTLYPRVELTQIGLAPLTSMFFFAPNDRVGMDDFRAAVHDSDGLAIWNGQGEWLWRPLVNPETLQVSVFIDDNPRGFGLLQRHRAFMDYQDLEARYERRPSLWVEAIGNWGEGAVQLVEIPSKSEIDDNMVAFWRPKQPLPAQTEYRFTYRLHWCSTPPVTPTLATVAATRTGAGAEQGTRRMVIDFVGKQLADLKPDAPVEPVITTSAGTVQQPVVQPNPATGGWRLSFVLVPGDAAVCDLRCVLKLGETLLSEVWLYRWTP